MLHLCCRSWWDAEWKAARAPLSALLLSHPVSNSDPKAQAHVGLRGIFILLQEDVIGTAGEKCKAGQFTSETGRKLTMKMVSPRTKGAKDFLPFEASQASTDGLTLMYLPSLTG